jgi:hypothetical protein
VVVSHGHGPLKALLAPLFVTFDALLGAMGGDVRWHLPITAWGRLPATLGRVKHDRLVAGGALGGDTVWLLYRVPEEDAMSALSQALHVALRQCTHASLVSLVASLGLTALTLPP